MEMEAIKHCQAPGRLQDQRESDTGYECTVNSQEVSQPEMNNARLLQRSSSVMYICLFH